MAIQAEPIHLDLMLDDRQGATCRVAPDAVVLAARRLYEEFRASSGARGMAMNDEEILATCWAPLAARLVAQETQATDSNAAVFAELALCFLVTAAFPALESGAHYTVTITADGKVTVERRPHHLLGRNHIVLGNHLQALGGAASGVARAR